MDVRSRILLPQWASALADGAKPFELQKYTTHKYGNAMKFAKPGAVLVVGASGSPTVVAFAVVHSVCRQILPGNGFIADLRNTLRDRDLRLGFDVYMRDAISVDVMLFQTVYDVRPLRLTWPHLERKLRCQLTRNNGFPDQLRWDSQTRLQDVMHDSATLPHSFLWPNSEVAPSSSSDQSEARSQKTGSQMTDSADSDDILSDYEVSQPPAKRRRVWVQTGER